MSESLLIFLSSQAFILSSCLIGIYVKFSTKLKELDIMQAEFNRRVTAVEGQDSVIIGKLDDIKDDVGEIKVEMQNKQNRI